jgi:segregation and condensation protein B
MAENEDNKGIEGSQVEGEAPGEDEEEDEEIVSIESMGREETRQALYALLFASDRPMSPTRLAEAISEHMDPEIVGMLLEELREDLSKRPEIPYFLKEIGGGYQLLTKPEFAPFIRRLFQIKRSKRLSKSVLETLAIIAYKQPTTRAEVEAIRGVSVSHAFEQLQERHFIKVTGISDSPGRPKLYRTTDDFLVQFGLGSLKELPTLEELQETR